MLFIETTLSILLLFLVWCESFFVNNTKLFAKCYIVAGCLLLLFGFNFTMQGHQRIILFIFLSIAIFCQMLYILFSSYVNYTVAVILSLLNFFGMYFIHLKQKSAISTMLFVAIAVIFLIPSVILGVTVLDSTPVIQLANWRIFRAKNSYEADETKEIRLKSGHKYINNVQYGKQYPNSFLDIYISQNDTNVWKDTIICVHGGGYVWGDKLDGDPNGNSSSLVRYFNPLLDAGYNIISVNYALAPQYLYPTPIYQLTQAVRFLQKNGDMYGLNMERVIFQGASAGGQIIGQFINIQLDGNYRNEMGIEPCIKKEHIKAVIFNSALLDSEKFSETGNWVLDWVFWLCGREYFNTGFLRGNRQVMQSNVISHIQPGFPPTFISDGNSGTFDQQAFLLDKRMNELGIEHTLNYYERTDAKLGHGFEMGTDVWAIDNMQKQLAFLRENNGGFD